MLKHCPRCKEELPVERFGIVRSRPDGRNCYCIPCAHAKVLESRQRIKANGAERQTCKPALPPPVQQPLEVRVLNAVRSGARTCTEIALYLDDFDTALRHALESSATLKQRLLEDEAGLTLTRKEIYWQKHLLTDVIGDALAELILRCEIRADRVDGRRVFLIRPKVAPSKDRQLSLFQLANGFGPKIRGESTQLRGQGREREAPEGLEPPACSRVA